MIAAFSFDAVRDNHYCGIVHLITNSYAVARGFFFLVESYVVGLQGGV
jgi:hypothetical protein